MRRWTLFLAVVGLAAGIVLFRPAPDPLRGVEAVPTPGRPTPSSPSSPRR